MFRKDLQDLAATRLQEARLLLAARMFNGAYYLGGLAVECALKACIARATRAFEFPDLNRTRAICTHSLDDLLRLAKLDDALRRGDPETRAAWTTVSAWRVDTRYELGVAAKDAEEFIQAAGGTKGVLPWTEQFWW